ncbi:MAG: SPOR domain-containing protein [Deltaproteobacteria bacterium]|nr:SPOR domain-containing protein [Deltaproteobacteria bacterium]
MKFTPGQITFLIFCLLAALFLDFYLGARFGPEFFWGISLDRLNRESLLPEEASTAELEALLAEETEKTTFHEVLENSAPSIMTAEGGKGEKKGKGKTTKEEKKEVKKETANKEEKTAQPVDPIAQVVAKESPPERYTLQVGSFSDPEQAESIKKAFISRGYSSFVKEVSISGKGKWYRVHVGQFFSEAEALKNQGVINRNYKIMPLVVKL